MVDADRIYSWTSSRNDAGIGHAPMVRQFHIERLDGAREGERTMLWHLDGMRWQVAFIEPLERRQYNAVEGGVSIINTYAIRDGSTGEQLDTFTIVELPDDQSTEGKS